MRARRIVVCLLMLAGALSAHAIRAGAQSDTATLSGAVVDETGATLADVSVSAINTDTKVQRDATTGSDGEFALTALQPGHYVVHADREGFTPTEIPDLTLNVGDRLVIQIQLQVAGVGESVTVSAEPSRIRTSPGVGTVVDRRFVENLPLNGRSLESLITLTPGVVLIPNYDSQGSFSVNGQRGTSNYFTVDGVSANLGQGTARAGMLPTANAIGSTTSMVSIDALQEFQVQTSGYAAEYGRSPGAQISMVTRSGTNVFHGTLFEYLRNEVLDANDWFANRAQQSKAALRQNQFGGVLGGPVLLPGYDGHSRTFFFFSYEGLRLRTPKFAITQVPSLALREIAAPGLRPFMDGWPLPNGHDFGNGLAEFAATYSDEHTLNTSSLRLDHRLHSSLTLFGRYNHAPSHSRERSSYTLTNVSARDFEMRSLTLGATAIISPRITNELRFNHSQNPMPSNFVFGDFGGSVSPSRDLFLLPQFITPDAGYQGWISLFPAGPTGPATGLSLSNFTSQQESLNIVNTLAVSAGTHQLKLGVDYRRLTPLVRRTHYSFGASFTSQQEIMSGIASTGYLFTESGQVATGYDNLSLFAQDTWQISSRLTLHPGLRWELIPPPERTDGGTVVPTVIGFDDPATMQLAPPGTSPFWETRYNNFAPRLGLSYLVSEAPGRELVVRAGVGRYYDGDPAHTSSALESDGLTGNRVISNVQFPLVESQVAPIPPDPFEPPYGSMHVFRPDLRLPYTWQWNVSVERSLGPRQTVTVGYVGAAGRDLYVRRVLYNLQVINPDFTELHLTTNEGRSDYHSLQLQYQRRLSRGLQVLASYTLSHAEDLVSVDNGVRGYNLLYADADFDVRHNGSAAVSYDLPSPQSVWPAAVFGRWSVDARFTGRSGLPFNITAGSRMDPATGLWVGIRPLVVDGQPLTIDDPSMPGGWRVNRAAFEIPAEGEDGNFGRNVLRGFGAWQVDLALRRQFPLAGRTSLQLRAEAFNVFNHPNFGTIESNLTSPNFGQGIDMLGRQLGGLNALYQVGGPRSLQFALRFQF